MDRQVILRNRLARRQVIGALWQLFCRAGFRWAQGPISESDKEGFIVERDGVELVVEWRDGAGLEIRFAKEADERCRDEVLDLITQRRSPEDFR